MSTVPLFGPWDKPAGHDDLPPDILSDLWYMLAAQKVGTPDQVNNCGLSQRRSEITMLWELYRRAKPKVVLEVGVAQGGTWASWCFLGEFDATLIGIDRDVNDCRPRTGDPVNALLAPPHLQNRVTTHGGGMYAYAKGQQRIIPINGWTTSPAVKEELGLVLRGRKIDWCFHDASHGAEQAMHDWNWLWPLVAQGGVMALHDIMPSSDPRCNKKEAWDEIKATVDYSMLMEFTASRNEQNMGIGVIVK